MFLAIALLKEKTKPGFSLVVSSDIPITVVNEAIENPPLFANKTNKVLTIKCCNIL